MEVVEWDPEKLMGVKHSGMVTGTGKFTLSPISGGTRFSWDELVDLPWHFAGKFGEKFAKPLLTTIWRRNLRSLRKRILERQEAGTGAAAGGLINVGSEWELRHYGPDHVVRTSTQDLDLSREAEALEILASTGFPVPRLAQRLSTSSLVIERIDGPTMLEDLTSRPWTLSRHAKNLARLHKALGKIPAPTDWESVSDGGSIVHLDLHPGTIKMNNGSPVVLNWNRSARGSSSFDAAVTYVILRTAESNSGRLAQLLISSLRKRFAKVFVKEFGAAEVLTEVREAAELRLLDLSLSPNEREAVFALARDELD
jgi:aminoglycoside phosphotransferase (APT) family kinase protein